MIYGGRFHLVSAKRNQLRRCHVSFGRPGDIRGQCCCHNGYDRGWDDKGI